MKRLRVQWRPPVEVRLGIAACGLVLAAVACGDDDDTEGGRTIEVTATDYRFTPSDISVEPGEDVTIRLVNNGAMPHNIRFELPDESFELDDDVSPGDSAELRITAPEQTGDYVFYCPVSNHRALGMEGTLAVGETDANGTAAVELEPVAEGLVSPVAVAFAPDGGGRMFIVDQVGVIRIRDAGGSLLEQPFLDLRDSVIELDPQYDERGLLGLAFHPDFATNGRFFVYYSTQRRAEAPGDFDHTSRLSEFEVSSPSADEADRGSERVILEVDQPQANHNAGTLAFGRDGFLYLSLGDGGGAGDIGVGHPPLGNGQDLTTLLGSILRLDVDGGDPYGVPGDNPFVGREGRDEIYAYGFRNPYRFSFDMGGSYGLFVGDVGQNLWEEVNLVELGGNYGWNIREGTRCFDPQNPGQSPAECASEGPQGEPLRSPIIEYANANQQDGLGHAVVGGYVYRGPALPSLEGKYVFGDWSSSQQAPSGVIFVAEPPENAGEMWSVQELSIQDGLDHFILGFGQDPEGEIYVLTTDRSGPADRTGRVYRLVPVDTQSP